MLRRIAREGGGSILGSYRDVFRGELMQVSGRVDITPFLLFFAVAAFLVDIAARRLSINYRRVKETIGMVVGGGISAAGKIARPVIQGFGKVIVRGRASGAGITGETREAGMPVVSGVHKKENVPDEKQSQKQQQAAKPKADTRYIEILLDRKKKKKL